MIVYVTKYSCVFAAAFVRLTPAPTESAQQSFERIERIIWALPVLTDVFMLLITLRVTAMLFYCFADRASQYIYRFADRASQYIYRFADRASQYIYRFADRASQYIYRFADRAVQYIYFSN